MEVSVPQLSFLYYLITLVFNYRLIYLILSGYWLTNVGFVICRSYVH